MGIKTPQQEIYSGLSYIKVAGDHSLIARALVAGVIRWDLTDARDGKGILLVDEMKYVTWLDKYGVPELCSGIRDAIIKALESKE